MIKRIFKSTFLGTLSLIAFLKLSPLAYSADDLNDQWRQHSSAPLLAIEPEEKLAIAFNQVISGQHNPLLENVDFACFIPSLYHDIYPEGFTSSPMTLEHVFLNISFYHRKETELPKEILMAIEDYLIKVDPALSNAFLGIMYEEGIGYPKNIPLARELFTKSAETGLSFAQRELASLLSGNYLEEEEDNNKFLDVPRAIYLYEQAMAQGDETAQIDLANIYTNPRNNEFNPLKAIELLTPLAEAGSLEARLSLSMVYSSWLSIDSFFSQNAVENKRKAYALLFPLPPENSHYYKDFIKYIACVYTDDYPRGSCEPHNIESIISALEFLQAQGDTEAQDMLEKISQPSKLQFESSEIGVQLLKQHSEQDPNNLFFKKTLADDYARGRGTVQNIQRAIELRRDLITQGDRESIFPLLSLLGPDGKAEVEALLKENLPTHPEFALDLALFCMDDKSDSQNEQKAAQMLEPLAVKGCFQAAYHLYHLYLYGSDAIKDQQKAHEFITEYSKRYPYYTAEKFLMGDINPTWCRDEQGLYTYYYCLRKINLFRGHKSFPWDTLTLENIVEGLPPKLKAEILVEQWFDYEQFFLLSRIPNFSSPP